MASVNDLQFHDNGTQGFFNEGEVSIQSTIESQGSGVYKLTQNKAGQFTAVEKVENVDDSLALNENGRISVIGEGEADDFLYVKFVI